MSRMVFPFRCRWTKRPPCCWISWCQPWILPILIAHLDHANWLRIIRIYHIAASEMQNDRHDELSKLVRWPTNSTNQLTCVIIIYISVLYTRYTTGLGITRRLVGQCKCMCACECVNCTDTVDDVRVHAWRRIRRERIRNQAKSNASEHVNFYDWGSKHFRIFVIVRVLFEQKRTWKPHGNMRDYSLTSKLTVSVNLSLNSVALNFCNKPLAFPSLNKSLT